MRSGGVGNGGILEEIVGDGRCDWSGCILQEGLICGFGWGWNSGVYECESESLVVMFLHFGGRQRGPLCVEENIKREKKKKMMKKNRRDRCVDEKKKRKKERKEK